MGAITLPCSSVDEVLNGHSAALKQWFADKDHVLDGLMVRKFPSRLEPDQFMPSSSETPFNVARFRLMMSNAREEWRITLEMVFHSRPRLMEDGSAMGSGILFNVLDEEGAAVTIDYFAIGNNEFSQPLSAGHWCLYWFKKLSKSPKFNQIFAYKTLEKELE